MRSTYYTPEGRTTYYTPEGRGYLYGVEGLGRHRLREHDSVGGLELHSRREHVAAEGELGHHGRRGHLGGLEE